MKTKLQGTTLILFIASLAGIYISLTLLSEDVISTAHTLFEYFPNKFQVIPASTWNGAIRLGLFITVMQVISAGVGSSNRFSGVWRAIAWVLFGISLPFDMWTDMVYRSNEFQGNVWVAVVTTVGFYTFGSELLQTLSWLILIASWRVGIREGMWTMANLKQGVATIASEWHLMVRSAHSNQTRDVVNAASKYAPGQRYNPPPLTEQKHVVHAAPEVTEYKAPSIQQQLANAGVKTSNITTGSNIPRPAPKPRPMTQGSFIPPEPTYHPVMDMENNDKRYNA
jgi:hypothetical protein